MKPQNSAMVGNEFSLTPLSQSGSRSTVRARDIKNTIRQLAEPELYRLQHQGQGLPAGRGLCPGSKSSTSGSALTPNTISSTRGL